MKIKQTGRIGQAMLVFLCFLVWASQTDLCASNDIETPEHHFGFKPGSDRMLFDYEDLIAYLQKLDASSSRVKLADIGKSPMGKRLYIAFISSGENIQNLDTLRAINRRLALEPDIPESEKESLLNEGKVFFLATLSMHADEVGPAQSAPLIAYDLATTTDPQKKEWLDNVVYMMVPSHNPDGMDMVVNHYNKYKGTKYEGSSMPGVYHKYIGHDNNRDFLTLSQEDTKAIARIYSRDWFPQVMVEKHQMGSRSMRYFVPPVHDPIAENIDAGLWNWTGIIGSNMMTDMTKQGLAGVAHHYLFDDYAPLYTTICMWKNVISFLTEAASAKDATPIYIEENELGAYGKGLSEYKKSINMPLPWPGGWWKLSDIIAYEITSTLSIIKTASLHRRDILIFRNELCRKEVRKGKTSPPYYYILPLQQHDASELANLVNLLKEHGTAVYRLSQNRSLEGRAFNKGDIVIPLAQPFRAFIKEVMEVQKYPIRHYTPGGEIIKPYDVTSWSLPLHRGVKAVEIANARSEEFESAFEEITDVFALRKDVSDKFWAAVFTARNNESFRAAFLCQKLGMKVDRLQKAAKFDSGEAPGGSFVVRNDPEHGEKMEQVLKEMKVSPLIVNEPVEFDGTPLRIPRIALVETYFHDADAGWTRFLFDTFNLPYRVVHPGDFEKTDLAKDFDVVIFPDAEKSILMKGKEKVRGEEQYVISSYPPEFTRGIEKKGMERLMTFLNKGGLIISWGQSTALFMDSLEIKGDKDGKEEFQLPVRDISQRLRNSGLYCPGSLFQLKLKTDHPLTLGMPGEVGVLFEGRPVFATSIPDFDMDRRVIGKFPESNGLLSGYCEKEDLLANRASLVWLKKGNGQLVLFGFNPIFRASSQSSYRLLFNAILLPQIAAED